MRTTQVYVDDPWDVRSYRTKLETLYRVMHGLKKRSKVDAAKVQQYSLWLIPNIEQIYRYMKQTYTNISVLSSMMLPVVSVLRKELGLHDQTTDTWRQEATDLRIQATQEASRNIQGKDFKTYQDLPPQGWYQTQDRQRPRKHHWLLEMVCPVFVHHAATATRRLGHNVHHW